MPLKIIVVGAGIAGLCAAVSLRQAGHDVEIFEKSAFAAEIGAALALTPNGARVLSRLGFSFERARALKVKVWDTVRGDTLDPIVTMDLSAAEKRFGAAAWAVHRVDLHNELLRLALDENAGAGKPAVLRLGAPVVSATTDGWVELKDGSRHSADLVVGADGLHSVLKGVVLGQVTLVPKPTGMSAFRFLIDTELLNKDAKLAALLKKKAPEGATILADTKEVELERHIMWYACRGGETQNFVGVHPTRMEDYKDGSDDMKVSMLQEFGHFHPDIVQIIAQASHIKCWPLFVHDPFPTWSSGKIILIGDAAHPMLPFGGQGSNQAIEDGGSLGYIFTGVDDSAEIEKRLSLFERVRRNRASRVQILSKARAGREKEVEQELRHYADPPGSAVPTTFPERTGHDFGFDVFAKCNEVLQRA